MSKKTKRPGSGRTKGSFCFVNLTLSQLKSKVADENAPIKVSRKWAEAIGFEGLTSQAVKELDGKIEGTTPDTQVPVKTTNFNDEDEAAGVATDKL